MRVFTDSHVLFNILGEYSILLLTFLRTKIVNTVIHLIEFKTKESE